MAECGRIQVQISAQGGEPTTKTQWPGLPGFAFRQLSAAGGRCYGGEVGSRSQLPKESIHLVAGILHEGGQERRSSRGLLLPPLFGNLTQALECSFVNLNGFVTQHGFSY